MIRKHTLTNTTICGILLLSGTARASDAMHVPLLVKYHQESHFVAGALVGLAMNEWMRGEPIHPVGKVILASFTALGVGGFKEFFIDKNPRIKEIGPWGLGAATVTLGYVVRW